MNESPVDIKTILKSILFSFFIGLTVFLFQFTDSRTKVVFCDVGQGDAAYIRVKNKIDVLVDAGPDKKVLNCLGRHMPFWDRKIEMAILSHPQKDHFGGFIDILDRYKIGYFLTASIKDAPVESFKRLGDKLKNQKVSILSVKSHDVIKNLDYSLTVYWPPAESKLDDNDNSLVFLFQENNRSAAGLKILFTGDSSSFVLKMIAGNGHDRSLPNIDILKVPHHGSKNGLTEKFLELADPKVAVISVGKNNSYGHPSEEVLAILKALKTKIKRTDKEGDIIFKIN